MHLTSLWNLLIHCHTSRRYLSVECQVMGVYLEPQSPQKIFVENGELQKVAFPLSLHPVPFLRLDDGRMAVLYIILRNLALVDFRFLLKEVHRVSFLQKCGTLIFFICKDTQYRFLLPHCLSSGCENAVTGQFSCDGGGGFAGDEIAVNAEDDFCFLGNDFGSAVRTFAVTEESFIRQLHLAVREALSLSPGHVLGDGTAFLLGEG